MKDVNHLISGTTVDNMSENDAYAMLNHVQLRSGLKVGMDF